MLNFHSQIVNAATSVLLADITSGLIGVCASTFLIVIFGEVMPQSPAMISLCMAGLVLWQNSITCLDELLHLCRLFLRVCVPGMASRLAPFQFHLSSCFSK